MSSLAEEILQQQERVRELLTEYEKIPTGIFGAAMLKQLLKRTEVAVMNQDPVEMLLCYEELKECK